jgi:hypothetical protein
MQAVPIDRITPTLYNDAGQVKGNGNALEGRSEEPIRSTRAGRQSWLSQGEHYDT